MFCDKASILGKPAVFGMGLALLFVAPALAQGNEGTVDNVRDALTQAGTATKNAGESFWDLVKSNPWKYGHLMAAGLVVVILLIADVIRPGSLERAGKRSVEPHNCLLWFASAMIVYCAMLLGAKLVWRTTSKQPTRAGSLNTFRTGQSGLLPRRGRPRTIPKRGVAH